MELKECIFTRRSVRRFDARPVPHKVLEQVVEVEVLAQAVEVVLLSQEMEVRLNTSLLAILKCLLELSLAVMIQKITFL